MNNTVYTTRVNTTVDAVYRLLDEAALPEKIGSATLILIKPNLVEPLQPPVTTPVDLVDALIGYLQKNNCGCKIVVGEGTGAIEHDTHHCFDILGYSEMAQKRGVELIDLNVANLVKKENPGFSRWPELYLPGILDEAFLFSVPVLKAHTLSDVTLTMKNMMGCVPPSHYRRGNSWGKSAFHDEIDAAIFDLNQYRCPDFTLLDASIGMPEAHLWGRHCDPPVGLFAASCDPVAIDSYGAALLGKKWQNIGHIELAHSVLGEADPLCVVEL